MNGDFIYVAVPRAALAEQLACPRCGDQPKEFDRPALGEPWRVSCSNMHVYTVTVDLGAFLPKAARS